MNTLARNRDGGNVERLCVHVSIHRKHELFSEARRSHQRRCQYRFVKIGASARVVVLRSGKYGELASGESESEQKNKKYAMHGAVQNMNYIVVLIAGWSQGRGSDIEPVR